MKTPGNGLLPSLFRGSKSYDPPSFFTPSRLLIADKSLTGNLFFSSRKIVISFAVFIRITHTCSLFNSDARHKNVLILKKIQSWLVTQECLKVVLIELSYATILARSIKHFFCQMSLAFIVTQDRTNIYLKGD